MEIAAVEDCCKRHTRGAQAKLRTLTGKLQQLKGRLAQIVAGDLLGKKIVRILPGGNRIEGIVSEIDSDFYGEDLIRSKRIWVEDVGTEYKENRISKLPRVGIDYAEEWKNKKLRFLVKSIKQLGKSRPGR